MHNIGDLGLLGSSKSRTMRKRKVHHVSCHAITRVAAWIVRDLLGAAADAVTELSTGASLLNVAVAIAIDVVQSVCLWQPTGKFAGWVAMFCSTCSCDLITAFSPPPWRYHCSDVESKMRCHVAGQLFARLGWTTRLLRQL